MKVLLVKLTLFSLIILFSTISGFSQQTHINGPTGSIAFGQHVVALSNGNFVVTDPYYSLPGGAANIGAVRKHKIIYLTKKILVCIKL